MLSDKSVATVSKTKHVIFDVLGKWCKSYAAVLFITFCEMAVGLHILKFAGLYKGGYIFVIAICTALLDILPVFGTGTVLIPWGVISLFTHKIGLGIGLLVIYGLITVIRQIVEPRIVSANVDIHPVITLMSMYIGIQVFGVFGILILPITVVIIKTLNDEGIIHIWGNGVKSPSVKDRKTEKKKNKKAAEIAENNEIPQEAETAAE
jgi:predicted PurR-regulated permease PerM